MTSKRHYERHPSGTQSWGWGGADTGQVEGLQVDAEVHQLTEVLRRLHPLQAALCTPPTTVQARPSEPPWRMWSWWKNTEPEIEGSNST